MTDLVIAIFSGTTLGIVAGVLPGISPFGILLLIFPWLLEMSSMEILFLYISLLSASQYFGSVTSIYFGIAGESSSFPAVIEGHALYKQGREKQAIMFTSLGSFIGTFFGFLAFAGFVVTFKNIYLTSLQEFTLLLMIGIISTFLIQNSNISRLLMFTVPLALAHLGMKDSSVIPKTDFEIDFFKYGIQYFPIVMAMICAKEILADVVNVKSDKIQQSRFDPFEFFKYKYSMLRGIIIGAVGGLLPGLTTIAGSNISYSVEKKITHDYKKGNMNCLISAETANNVSSITQLAPLIVFGLPITASEMVVYDILENKGWSPSGEIFWTIMSIGWPLLLVANFVVMLLAWKYARVLTALVPKNGKQFQWIMLVVCALIVYTIGNTIAFQGWQFLFVFLVCLPIAIFTKQINYMPLAYWLIISDTLLSNFYRLFQIY